MTQPGQAQSPQEAIVNPRAFELMQEASWGLHQKEFSELDYFEACGLLVRLVLEITQGSDSEVRHDGLVVAESNADGREALAGHGHQLAHLMASRVNEETELIIHVARKRTFWDIIRRRRPKVVRTFHFRNEPPQKDLSSV